MQLLLRKLPASLSQDLFDIALSTADIRGRVVGCGETAERDFAASEMSTEVQCFDNQLVEMSANCWFAHIERKPNCSG